MVNPYILDFLNLLSEVVGPLIGVTSIFVDEINWTPAAGLSVQC